MFQLPGPYSQLIPVVPKVPMAFVLNAAVLKYFAMRSCLLRSPGMDQSPTRSAVSLPMPVSELSSPERTVNGAPLIALAMPLNCHPPRANCCHMGEPVLPQGDSHNTDVTKLCVRLRLSAP